MAAVSPSQQHESRLRDRSSSCKLMLVTCGLICSPNSYAVSGQCYVHTPASVARIIIAQIFLQNMLDQEVERLQLMPFATKLLQAVSSSAKVSGLRLWHPSSRELSMHISPCAEMTVQADSDIKPDAQGGIAIR